jgi:hypothetical protein
LTKYSSKRDDRKFFDEVRKVSIMTWQIQCKEYFESSEFNNHTANVLLKKIKWSQLLSKDKMKKTLDEKEVLRK